MGEAKPEEIRTPGQVRHQLRQVMFRHLQRELRDNFRVAPETCVHNYEEAFTEGPPGRVGVCRYEGDGQPSPQGRVCDGRVAGCRRFAKACPMWRPIRTKDEVKFDFRDLMTATDRGRIASYYPDVAALMWVLDGVDFTEDVALAEAEVDGEAP